MTEKLDCYYCLTEDVKPAEKTRDGYWICPECSIDSVDIFENFQALYAKHCRSFHFGTQFRIEEELIIELATVPVSCGHTFCKLWDKLVRKVRNKE